MKEWCFENDLHKIDNSCWNLLEEGVKSHRSQFHYGVFATLDQDFPAARTVIIRSVNPELRTISFNTDIRSPKFQQLAENPKVSWLFYDASLRIQLRCKAVASLHVHDPIAQEGWEKARLNCKITYTAPTAPGTQLDAPFLLDLNQLDISDEKLVEARNNFSVVQTKVVSLDWCFLHHKGNRRAYIDYEKNEKKWIQV
ncbi:MAG: pyridoxamine 5'-phosphate oxidase family protein [Bacteroidetes bacterium]|nr:pyridoxamine 5'-phosphate oxidase family protein [Bacteroidota bacterium]